MEQGTAAGWGKRFGQMELVLPGAIDFEPVAVQSAGAVAAQAGLSASRVEDVKTAVGEAFINAVEHGNGGRPDRQVTLRFCPEADGLRIEVLDFGPGFDFDRTMVPHMREKIEGRESRRGWGLFLIRQLVDHLEVHRRLPSGCCLSLTVHPESYSLDP